MTELEKQAQFEAALTTEVYNAAWRYAWRLAASRRGGCHEEAEDLLQESLAHAWRQYGQLRERKQFKAWLLSIVRTRHLDRLRRLRRRPQAVEEPPAGLAQEPARPDDALAVALARLRPAERELLQLFYLEELSLEQVAQTLGLGPRAVRQRMYRARASLRRALGPVQGEPDVTPGHIPEGHCHDTV